MNGGHGRRTVGSSVSGGPTGRQNEPVRIRVVIVAGPSGTGKSRLAQRTGLPMVQLDDFYRNGSDPDLPRIAEGPHAGIVDWDHPDSWLPQEAVAALVRLCRTGRTELPIYDMTQDGRCGTTELVLPESGGLVLAEGIFAQDIVAACRAEGILGAALCLDRSAVVTAARRLARDLKERRKKPSILLKRGWHLMRRHRAVVADAVAKGCEPVSMDGAVRAIAALAAPQSSAHPSAS